MGKDELIPIKEWIDILNDFYKTPTIRKLFNKNKGNGNALYEILHSKISKCLQKEAYILKYLEQKPKPKEELMQTARDVFATGAKEVQVSIRKKCDKAEKALINNNENYILKSSDDDFIALVNIIRRYIERVEREKMMRNIIDGDSLFVREKKAKKILEDTEKLLHIIGVDCKIPRINFVELSTIKSEAIRDIENLKNTSLNYTPGKLLDELYCYSEEKSKKEIREEEIKKNGDYKI